MSVSSIFFAGRVIRKPGAYSSVDASALEPQNLSATGVVGLLATGEGGVPYSSVASPADVPRFDTPDKALKTYRSGNLREAIPILFNPSGDAAIPGGAAQVVALKVNPATQSSLTLQGEAVSYGSSGTTPAQNVASLPSRDYGAFTTQIATSVAAGTTKGKLISVKFEGTTQAADDVGETNDANNGSMFDLQYREQSTSGWDTAVAQVLASGVRVNATRTEAGEDGQVTASAPTAPLDTAQVVSASAGDTTQTITIYGKTTGNVIVRETLQLNGTNAVNGTQQWTAIYGAVLSAVCAGNVTVVDANGPLTMITLTAGQTTRGVALGVTMYVASAILRLISSGASTKEIHLWGASGTGALQAERVVLTGTTPVRTVGSWTRVDALVLGNMEALQNLTVYGPAAQSTNAVQTTLEQLKAYFDARSVPQTSPTPPFGFEFLMKTGSVKTPVASLDLTNGTGASIVGAYFHAQADLAKQLDFFANQSSFVGPATRIAFAPLIVDFTIVYDVGTTYTITINGTAFTSVGAGSATAARDALIAKIADSSAVKDVVTPSANGAGVVRLTAQAPASGTPLNSGFAYSQSAAGGAGTLTPAVSQAAAGANQPLRNTSGFLPLVGGSEGTTSFANWQAALNLLKKIRVNTIVVWTGDPAVQAALSAHIAFMNTIGKSERDGVVGLSALDGSLVPTDLPPTKTSTKAQIVNLNTKDLRAIAQTVDRFNTAGVLTTFPPYAAACVAAGMQASAPVGEPLTNKYANVQGFNQDSSWNPVDDVEELLASGLMMLEDVPGVGRRWIRNITTWLKDSNLAYTEASVNQAVNFTTFEFRTAMEAVIGRRGTPGTLAGARGIAQNKLGQLANTPGASPIISWRSLSLSLVLDVLDIAVEVAPVIPINFAPIAVHLRTVALAA